jgi:GTP-binding protein
MDRQTGIVIRDLVNDGDEIIAARGGRGGWGNTHFKCSTNQAPRETTPGGMGEQRRVILELKSIADVGLIGMPNAGKSTMLSRLSRARPEIADYPFTTKFPNLGLVSVDIDRTFVLADNEVRDALAELVGREDVMIVSAVTGQGLNQLVTRISELLALQKTQAV